MKRVLLSISLLSLSACSGNPPVITETPISVASPGEVFVTRYGWHTGFVVPSADVQSLIPELRERFGDTPYLEFGWGDKAYYESEKVTSGLAVGAVLASSRSVVKVRAIRERPDLHPEGFEVEWLCLDDRQYSLLLGFIESSFYRDQEGNIIFSKDGKQDTRFYEGVGSYYLFNTCNTWTARGLSSAGLDIAPASKLRAGSVMSYLAARDDGPATGRCQETDQPDDRSMDSIAW